MALLAAPGLVAGWEAVLMLRLSAGRAGGIKRVGDNRQDARSATGCEMESESQSDRSDRPDGDRPWRRAVWGPIGLVAANAFATYALNPIGSGFSFWGMYAAGLMMGAMLCQPMQCALWSAWAPYAYWTRVPIGFAACVSLGIVMMVADGDPTIVLRQTIVFVVFAIPFSILRGATGVALRERDAVDGVEWGKGFSIRDLLGWITGVAVLLAFGQFVAYGSDASGRTAFGLFKFVAGFVGFVAFGLLPAIGIGLSMLGAKRRIAACAAALVIGVPISSALLTAMVRVMTPRPASSAFLSEWPQVGAILVGATLSMFIFAAVLRWAGYRLTRGPSAG